MNTSIKSPTEFRGEKPYHFMLINTLIISVKCN